MKIKATLLILLGLITISVFAPLSLAATTCVVPADKTSGYNQCLNDAIVSLEQCNALFKTQCTTTSELDSVFGTIKVPNAINKIGLGVTGVNNIIRLGVGLMFVAGGLLCVVYVIWGAIDVITAGGKKDGAAEGQKKITYALVGLVLLGLSFVIIRVVAQIVGLGSLFRF